MKRVLVLGAGGQTARWVTKLLAETRDVKLTLHLWYPGSLDAEIPRNAQHIQVDALDDNQLTDACVGHDMVYVSLAGCDIDRQAKKVVNAMKAAEVRRLLFVGSLGVYDEVPGEFGEWIRREVGPYLAPFRRAADIIETSGLDYTILRPAWLTDDDEVDYETTKKGEYFRGTAVSRKSVAALIAKMINNPHLYSRSSLGVSKPGTEGSRPYFVSPPIAARSYA